MRLLEPTRHMLSVQTAAEVVASETTSCSEDHSDGHESRRTTFVTRGSADSQKSRGCMPAQAQVPSAPVSQPCCGSAQVSSHADVSPVVRAQSSKEAKCSTNSINDSSKHSSYSQLLLWDP